MLAGARGEEDNEQEKFPMFLNTGFLQVKEKAYSASGEHSQKHDFSENQPLPKFLDTHTVKWFVYKFDQSCYNSCLVFSFLQKTFLLKQTCSCIQRITTTQKTSKKHGNSWVLQTSKSHTSERKRLYENTKQYLLM